MLRPGAGDGKGGIGAAPEYHFPGGDLNVIATGDYNGDGKLDLAIPNFQKLDVLLGMAMAASRLLWLEERSLKIPTA